MECKNFDNLSPEDRAKLEELQYRRQLIRLHGFALGEYSDRSKLSKDEIRKKLEKELNK